MLLLLLLLGVPVVAVVGVQLGVVAVDGMVLSQLSQLWKMCKNRVFWKRLPATQECSVCSREGWGALWWPASAVLRFHRDFDTISYAPYWAHAVKRRARGEPLLGGHAALTRRELLWNTGRQLLDFHRCPTRRLAGAENRRKGPGTRVGYSQLQLPEIQF